MQQRFSVLRFLVYLIAFTSLLLLRLVVAPDGQSGMVAYFACVGAAAAAYLVWYASSAGYSRNLLAGVLVYLTLAIVVAACPPFVLVLAFWSLSGLARRRRALLVHALASVALFVLVFPLPFAQWVGAPELAGAPAGLAYVVFATGWSAWAARSPLRLGLFKFATMLLAVPLVASFVALVGGGMLSRPERRVRNSMRRAQRAMTLALPAPAADRSVVSSGTMDPGFAAAAVGGSARTVQHAAVAAD
ncbi:MULTISPECIES: hypothetical protein [unclassified Caballeronia]|uniref:hypothetical protein n=1 Tax=unclassified Caballeronia TaxID=2646786 RepID=UPI0028652CEA|nr:MULTISPECIES: hypothetical protein [unclassified Caballeronia]MDR5816839.1 hypothetical protein [Caballeronia sp. LZ033]MDR5823750.1 hypothetical protein [Caballeronia sp. LZ043]